MSWCCASCCRWPTRGCVAGESRAKSATGTSASSKDAPRPDINGATWQVSTVQALQERGMTRPKALAEMLQQYCERMHSNDPVHSWKITG